ncbi:MAG TPA: VCBS repeat-containing protein, partial [bacterium]|nr:VCBS repeat-containing protein [bacterium]
MAIRAKGTKGFMSALTAGFLFSASIPLLAQTFDTPPTSFILEGEGNATEGTDLPATLNIGNFDPSIQGPDGLVLNEVVIAAMSIPENDTTLRHRYWTIVHDNAADPRSLVQTAPSDILVTDPEDPFYFSPSSLQVVDLNGDASDDIAFTSLRTGVSGAAAPSGIKNIATGAGPASVFGVPSQAGPNFFETSLNVLGGQTEGSLFAIAGELDPNFAAADFDGDGVLDLAFYDFSSGNQIAVTLQNNGTLGTLPATESQLNLPPALAGLDSAVNLVAVDLDGDGPVDLAITVSGPELQGSDSFILAYKGNGDGTFVSDPMVTIALADGQLALSLAAGNFDGNEFLDFAAPVASEGLGASAILIALCSPGAPVSCTTELLQPASDTEAMFQIVSTDFDEDGLDD